MRISEAREVLGVSADASFSQVKEAYKKKALETHPDRLPPSLKKHAEAEFKLTMLDLLLLWGNFVCLQITEAYTCVKTAEVSGHPITEGARGFGHGFVRGGSRLQYAASAFPFLFIIFGTIGLGGAQARRAYRENQKQASSQNPFLP